MMKKFGLVVLVILGGVLFIAPCFVGAAFFYLENKAVDVEMTRVLGKKVSVAKVNRNLRACSILEPGMVEFEDIPENYLDKHSITKNHIHKYLGKRVCVNVHRATLLNKKDFCKDRNTLCANR